MTPFAAASELTFVGVILLVAGRAACRQLVAKELARVAEVAFDPGMAAPQRKFRFVMIELNRLPHRLIVAVLAFGTIATQVNILQAVTFDAGGSNVGVTLAGVTGRAIDRPMRALQRKLGGVVIERLHVQPSVITMALVAFLSKLALVRIDRLVAIDTKSGRVAKLDGLGMTIAAGGRLVGTIKTEIRGRVVEGLAIELHDIGVSAFVVGVAHPAFLVRRIELTPVKFSARQAVRGDLLVTFKTLAGLRLPRECRMAAETVLLELGVPADERTRHDELLQQVL